jgi:hypothetical protein
MHIAHSHQTKMRSHSLQIPQQAIASIDTLSAVLDAMSNDKPRCVYATVDTVEQLRQVYQSASE